MNRIRRLWAGKPGSVVNNNLPALRALTNWELFPVRMVCAHHERNEMGVCVLKRLNCAVECGGTNYIIENFRNIDN